MRVLQSMLPALVTIICAQYLSCIVAHAEVLELLCKVETTELQNGALVRTTRRDALVKVGTDGKSVREIFPAFDKNIKESKDHSVRSENQIIMFNDGIKQKYFFDLTSLSVLGETSTEIDETLIFNANSFYGSSRGRLKDRGTLSTSVNWKITISRATGILEYEENQHSFGNIGGFSDYRSYGSCDVAPRTQKKF